MSYRENEDQLCRKLAEISGTDAKDWFIVFKARYGMEVVFSELAKRRGPGSVLTQAFTCATAIDPIIEAGLRPEYVDISPDTLMIDPVLVPPVNDGLALVMQHTFGIMAEDASRKLTARARDFGLLLIEDSAHCLGQMSRSDDGQILADISIHSFGAEKMLPTVFGGAVWVNPDLPDEELRAAIVGTLDSLPVIPALASSVSRAYVNENRVLTRVPGSISNPLRKALPRLHMFEPPIVDAERRGTLPHEPMRPSEWMIRTMIAGLDQLDVVRAERRAASARYFDTIAGTGVQIPAAASSSEALIRFPVFASDPGASERTLEAVRRAGLFVGHWYRPLIFPGPLDPSAYNFDPNGIDLPVTRDLASRAVNFLTKGDEEAILKAAIVALPHLVSQRQGAQPAAVRQASGSVGESGVGNSGVGNSDFVPILLGTGLNAYSFSRCMHELYGVKSMAIGRARLDETADSSIVEVRVYPSFDDPKFIVDTLLGLPAEFPGRKLLLIPTIEFYTNVVSDNRDLLDQYFEIPVPRKELVDRLISKTDFYRTCNELGISYPATVIVDPETAEDVVFAGSLPEFPLIVKPADTDTYQRVQFPGKKKVYRAESLEELRGILSTIYASEYQEDIVLQEFLPGREEVMLIANSYSDQSGRVSALSIGQIVVTELNPGLIGNQNAIVSIDDPELAQQLTQFLESLGYTGLANFDLMVRGGEVMVLEVNVRAGASNFFTVPAGANLAEHCIEDLIYNRQLPTVITSEKRLWVNAPTWLVRTFTPKSLRPLLNEAREHGVHDTLDYKLDASTKRKLRTGRIKAKRTRDTLKYRKNRLNS